MDDKTREGLDRATARISAAFGMSTEATKRAIEAQIELAGYGKGVIAEFNAQPAYKGNRHERRKQAADASSKLKAAIRERMRKRRRG